jgi:ABC-2 type transport system permease protein
MLVLALIIHAPEEKKKEESEETELVSPHITHISQPVNQNIRNIGLITSREYKARVRTRGYILGTVALVVLLVVGAFVPTIIEYFSSNAQVKLAVVNTAGTVAGQDAIVYLDKLVNITAATNSSGLTTTTNGRAEFALKAASPAELEKVRREVRDGKLDLVMIVNRSASGELTFDYYTKESSNSTTLNLERVEGAAAQLNFLDKLSQLGLQPSQFATLFNPPQAKITYSQQEQNGRSQEETLAAYFVVMAGIILLFTTMVNYGVMVAQGAVEEKSSRVMEIIVNAATPFQLMLGKIIGIGLAGFTQIGIMVVAGGLAFTAQGPVKEMWLGGKSGGTSIDISGLSLGLLSLLIIYYVLGYLLYATLYAAIGSLLSRQEDVQNAMTPLTLIFLASYFVGIFAMQMPEVNWVAWISYIPFFTPMLMLTRAGLGNLQWWEVPLSVVVMIIAIVVFTWLAARVYRAGVLLYGQKPTLGKIWRLVRAG